MIVVDASAFLAILFDEPEGPAFFSRLAASGANAMSPVNMWESLVRAEAVHGVVGREQAEHLLQALRIHIEPVTAHHARIAMDAFSRFGRRTPANLNLGDCFAYALAAEQGEGLLYKGEGFPKTDVVPAA
jgi:ribonuclease VapC